LHQQTLGSFPSPLRNRRTAVEIFETISTQASTEIQSQIHVTTDGQSVCRGVKFTLEPVTRYYILSESCCVVSVGRPL
jgi:hypothetical protein